MSKPSKGGYVLAWAAVCAVAIVVLKVGKFGLLDLQVYRLGGATVLSGGDLYAARNGHGLLFTYPPFAGMVFVPLACHAICGRFGRGLL